MSTIINGTSSAITFPDSSVQNTSAIVSGYVPYANLPAGTILQVVTSNYGTYPTSTTSTSFTATGHSLSITPKFATSKIYLIVHFQTLISGGGAGVNFTFAKNGTNLNTNGFAESSVTTGWQTLAMNYVDSPATTSATTYAIYYKGQSAGTYYYCGNTNEYCVLTAMEIAA
jgi:hypothetical protein